MQLALYLAQVAYRRGEIPVGAVVVRDEEIIGWACNEKEARQDASAHAELLAMQRATAFQGSWRLTGATLYSTLEPCPMCRGYDKQQIEQVGVWGPGFQSRGSRIGS